MTLCCSLSRISSPAVAGIIPHRFSPSRFVARCVERPDYITRSGKERGACPLAIKIAPARVVLGPLDRSRPFWVFALALSSERPPNCVPSPTWLCWRKSGSDSQWARRLIFCGRAESTGSDKQAADTGHSPGPDGPDQQARHPDNKIIGRAKKITWNRPSVRAGLGRAATPPHRGPPLPRTRAPRSARKLARRQA